MDDASLDEQWDADVEVEPTADGRFVAVIVLTPPAEIGPPVRTTIAGVYDSPTAAECAAIDALAAMTRAA